MAADYTVTFGAIADPLPSGIEVFTPLTEYLTYVNFGSYSDPAIGGSSGGGGSSRPTSGMLYPRGNC